MGQLTFVCGISLLIIMILGLLAKAKWPDIEEKGYLWCGFIGTALTILGVSSK